MATPIRINTVLVDSVVSSTIPAPAADFDLPAWLFSLTDAEYRACSRDHIACGSTFAPDGRRMSINVERVSGNLMIQRYVEQRADPHHVVMRSLSDSFSEAGITKLDITWELTIRSLGERQCELGNRILVVATAEFAELMAAAGVTDRDLIRPQMQQNAHIHNMGEAPLFAADLLRKGKGGAAS